MPKTDMPQWYVTAREIGRKNQSVREAATELEISPSTACKWMQAAAVVDDLGLSDPDVHGMAKLAAVFRLSTALRRKALKSSGKSQSEFGALVRSLAGERDWSRGGRTPDPAGVAARLEAKAKALRATLRAHRKSST